MTALPEPHDPDDGMTATLPAAPSEATVDFAVPGVLRVRVHGPGRSDLAAVARDVGPPEPNGSEPPDVVVRFVDDLSPPRLHHLDGGRAAYGDEGGGVYVLEPTGGGPVAHVSQGERWGEASIVCRRGLGRVPFLSAALDLAALSRGWAPVHGSAWTTRDGAGVLVTGWARSGKTGALLAACERGATPVGDDRILLSRDGSAMMGVGRPVVVKDWHLTRLPLAGVGARPVRRAVARFPPILEGLLERVGARSDAGWTRTAGKALDRLRGRLSLEVDARDLVDGSSVRGGSRPDIIVILETHAHPSIVWEEAEPRTVAPRIAAQVEADLLPTLRGQLPFKYAAPGRGWPDVGRAPEVAEGILEEATRGTPAYLVRHPYPCSLKELDRAIAEVVAFAAAPGES